MENKKDRIKLLEEATNISHELYNLSCKARKISQELRNTKFTAKEEEEYGVSGLIDELEMYE